MIRKLVARADSPYTFSPVMKILLQLVLAISLVTLISGAGFLLYRAYDRKRSRKSALPIHHGSKSSEGRLLRHRRLTAAAAPYGLSSKAFLGDEKLAAYEEDEHSPLSGSPLPEIRITLPDEERGRDTRSSRVVSVTINEMGSVGLECYKNDQLPTYQKTEGDRFQSLDLERLGGLKEK